MEGLDLLNVMGDNDVVFDYDIQSDSNDKEVKGTTEQDNNEGGIVIAEEETQNTDSGDIRNDSVDSAVEEVVETDKANSPNLVYLSLLAEKGVIDALSEEELQEFSNLEFEEQTNKLLEIHDNSIYAKAHTMFNDYISSRPYKLRLIEENYQNGMSEEDAIRFAIEAPRIYNPVLETERDLQFERKVVLDHYTAILDGDVSKAEVLLAVDDEKGILKDKAIKLSTEKHSNWEKTKNDFVKQQEEQEAKLIENFNKEKTKFSEYLKQIDEIFPAIKLSKEDKTKIFAARYSPVQTDNGISTSLSQKISKNPEKANAIMAYLFDVLDVLDKPDNMEKVYKVGKTKQTNNLLNTWGKTNTNLTNSKVTRTATKKLEDFEFKF